MKIEVEYIYYESIRKNRHLYMHICISHSTNTHKKGMNPIILPPAMGK